MIKFKFSVIFYILVFEFGYFFYKLEIRFVIMVKLFFCVGLYVIVRFFEERKKENYFFCGGGVN